MHSHLFSATRSWPALIALCLSILFGIAGQLLMKWAAMRTVGVTLQWALLPPLALALLVYSVAVVNWIFAVQHLQLSIAYPVSSLNYVGILAGSRYFFGEQISMERAAGVALIFLGVLLVAVQFGRTGRRLDRAPPLLESVRR
jgi:multidrug transporter EmrE-like cation transporter